MRATILIMCGLVLGASNVNAAVQQKTDQPTEARDVSKLVEATKSVVAAMVEAGKKNQQLPTADTKFCIGASSAVPPRLY